MTGLAAWQGWNLRHLDSLLTRTLEAKKVSLPGVTTPYLYFGMWRSVFAWCACARRLLQWLCAEPAHCSGTMPGGIAPLQAV